MTRTRRETTERRGRRERRDKHKVVLPVGAATELLELIDDEPGRANEALLDDARDALADPYERIPSHDQAAARDGAVVALEIGDEARVAGIELIERDRTRRADALDRLRARLRGKLDAARARRRQRRPRRR